MRKRTVETTKKDPIHELGMKRAKASMEAWTKQRNREREDLRFQVPELQWDDASISERKGALANGVPLPPRPILSISKLDQPIQLVQNQQRAAHLGVNFHPLSADSNQDTADVLQGIYRHIERRSRAELGRNWAFDRASKVGMGFYVIGTEYDDEGGDPSDQRITIDRILDQSMVYLDPAAQQPDFSDGEFGFLMAWYAVDRFKREFPDADLPTADGTDLLGNETTVPNWVKTDGDQVSSVLVANYWYKEHDYQEVKFGKGQTRTQDNVTVWFCKHSSQGRLTEPQDTDCKYIPIVPVIGKELQPFDSDRRWVGIIGPAKDGQRLYNYAASTAVELAALESKAPFLVAEGQIEGYESWWQQANRRNLPYLPYKTVTSGGKDVGPPIRNQADPSKLGATMTLLQSAENFIQGTTTQYNESLGNGNSRDRSGTAIQQLQEQSETANSHYIANLADISMTYEALVVKDKIPKVYDRPGRIAQMLDMEDETEPVMLNVPFMPNDQGVPQQVAPNTPGAKHFDLTKGSYNVSITIGKSYQSRLQQGAEEIGQILQAQPQLMPLIGPLYFRNRDFPGAKEISELLKKVQLKQMPELSRPDNGQKPTPEQLEAQNQALQGQLQQATQAAQQMQQQIATDQAKQQATLQKAQIDAQVKQAIEQMKGEFQIQIQRMKEEAENRRTGAEIVNDSVEARKDREHDMVLESQKHAQDVEKAAVGTIAPLDLNFSGSNDQSLGSEDEY